MTVLYTTGFAIKYATAVAHKLSPFSGLELKDVLNYLALFFGYLAIYSLNNIYLFKAFQDLKNLSSSEAALKSITQKMHDYQVSA